MLFYHVCSGNSHGIQNNRDYTSSVKVVTQLSRVGSNLDWAVPDNLDGERVKGVSWADFFLINKFYLC